MSTLYQGIAAIVGVDGTVAYTGYGSIAVPTTSGIPRGIQFTDAADVVQLMSKGNEVVGVAIRNQQRQVTIDFIPTMDTADESATLAETRDQQRLPAIGSTITIAGLGPASGGQFNGTYQYLGGGTASFTAEGHVQFSLPCVAFAAGTFATVT